MIWYNDNGGDNMTQKDIDDARMQKVRKANELVQKARYTLSANGQKILLYLISLIPPNADHFENTLFSVKQFCEILGVDDSGGQYQYLKDALGELVSNKNKVWIPLANGRETLLHWIDWPEIDTSAGMVYVRLAECMRPYLLDLKANYTTYELIYVLKFHSKYSIRMYELVKSLQYHDDKPFCRTYPVDELRSLLDAEIYPEYKDFNRRVLKPAVEEINKFSDRNLEIVEHKQGRKVISLELVISAKTGAALDAVRETIGAPKRKPRSAPAAAASPARKPATPTRKSTVPAAAPPIMTNPAAAIAYVDALKRQMTGA